MATVKIHCSNLTLLHRKRCLKSSLPQLAHDCSSFLYGGLGDLPDALDRGHRGAPEDGCGGEAATDAERSLVQRTVPPPEGGEQQAGGGVLLAQPLVLGRPGQDLLPACLEV